jgi:hypothetical protein
MTELLAPDDHVPPKNADESEGAAQDENDYCVLHVAISGTEVGWLAWSGDSYLAIVQERVDATGFRFGTSGPDYILPPFGDSSQRGLGISRYTTAQFYLPENWWSKFQLTNGYLQCLTNMQYLGVKTPDDPYSAYVYAWNAYEALQVERKAR